MTPLIPKLGAHLALILVLAICLGVAGCGQAATEPPNRSATHAIRAMFYYPWFPQTWYSTDHYTPTYGEYSSDDAAVMSTQFEAMHFAGMDAVISSWWGKHQQKEETRFPAELAAAKAHDMKVAAYYEEESEGNTSRAHIETDLSYLHAYDAEHPGAYLHVHGKPVIFVYNTAPNDTCAAVKKWSDATHGFTDWYVSMKVFDNYRGCRSQPSSWHQYAPAKATDQQGKDSFTISPGFWKYSEAKPRLARDVKRWKSDVDAMRSSGAMWQLVTTFNEWGEGTAVEPAKKWAPQNGPGRYLTILHDELVGSPGSASSPKASS